MLIISIILIIISIQLIIYSCKQLKSVHQINESVDNANQLKEEKSKELDAEISKKEAEFNTKYLTYAKELNEKRNELEFLQRNVTSKQEELDYIQSTVTKTTENQKQLSQSAFENYCEYLIKSYDEKEKEYNEDLERLNKAYVDAQEREIKNLEATKEENNKQLEEEKERIKQEIAAAQEVLDQIRATRDAALKAQLREQEIKENNDNFRLKMSETYLKDISLLKSIKPQISNSIVIDKIIWSNYYQPIAKVRFPQIIGKATACGIYKLTDLTSGLAYIGQSNDICDRQKQHCKNALGVGNVTTENKLYKSMREDGLFNFTFEVLEECEPRLLDEKEKYYIGLYDTYNYGLNGTQGNSK